MRSYPVIELSVFSEKIGGGNLCGLVLEADELSKVEMLTIAKKAAYSETVFVCASEKGDWRLRFFMPNKETPLCGHGTIGAIAYLCQNQRENQHFQIETLAGQLAVFYDGTAKTVTMSQEAAQFKEYQGRLSELCRVLGIETIDLTSDLPVVYGSTGVWTLILPVKNEGVLAKMTPQTAKFPEVLDGQRDVSIHPFTKGQNGAFLGRHFSSYASGIKEDPVTGTASGVMAAYLLKYAKLQEVNQGIKIRQGEAIGQAGELIAQAKIQNNEMLVSITGQGVYNRSYHVSF